MKDFIKKYQFILLLFFISFILRLFYVLIVDTPIISDFKTMYDASLELLRGTRHYTELSYFQLWGYQMGHVVYQYLLLSIINHVTFLEIMNALISSFSVIFIYLISKTISTDKSARIVSFLYCFFPFPILLNSVLSNQQLPLLLTLISIYLFLHIDYDKYIKKSIMIGLLLGISNILRSEGIVIVFSLFIYSLLHIKKDSFKKIMISMLIILGCYIGIGRGTSYLFQKIGISQNGLENRNTYWKFVVGFNYETNGMYSDSDAMKYSGDSEKAKIEAINRMKKIDKIPMLFLKKTKILWYNSDLYWPIGHIENQNLYQALTIINQLFIIVFLVLGVFSIKGLLKFINPYYLLFILLMVYEGVYMLIEVMPRYAYMPHAFLAIAASLGIDTLCSFREKKKN